MLWMIAFGDLETDEAIVQDFLNRITQVR